VKTTSRTDFHAARGFAVDTVFSDDKRDYFAAWLPDVFIGLNDAGETPPVARVLIQPDVFINLSAIRFSITDMAMHTAGRFFSGTGVQYFVTRMLARKILRQLVAARIL
jgi:hypothetical protein